VHRHLRSLDLPRDGEGHPCAIVHPHRQDRDWQPLGPGEPLFQKDDGTSMAWEPGPGDPATVWPVFINEAAYEEKGIALSLTQREAWPVASAWGEALVELLA
jgi:aspartoacylase